MTNSAASLNTQEVTTALQAGIQAMFWGTMITAIAMPIAGAIGTKIAGKIAGTKGNSRHG